MATPLKLPKLFLRLVKGSPLTATEGDHNIKTLRDFGNQLASLVSEALNPDGTLKNSSVAKALMPFFAYFLPPLGSVRWALNAEPASVTAPTSGAWWLEANGQEVLIADYQKLYDFYQANGFVFGAAAAAGKFRLPDLGGRFWLSRKDGSVRQTTISSLTRTGDVATAVKTDHGFKAGETVTIEGAGEADYNGVFSIISATSSTFTFLVTGTPATPATGTITATVATGGYAAGEEGGSDEHKISAEELPQHYHFIANSDEAGGNANAYNPELLPTANNYLMRSNGIGGNYTSYYNLVGNDSEPDTLKTSMFNGGNIPFTNMPPYRVGVGYILAGYKIDGAWVGAPTF